MDLVFDLAKDKVNQSKHGVSLSWASRFEWGTAAVWEDVRKPYGEMRMIALGYIGKRLYVAVYIDRGSIRRIISLRKANSREVNVYAQT